MEAILISFSSRRHVICSPLPGVGTTWKGIIIRLFSQSKGYWKREGEGEKFYGFWQLSWIVYPSTQADSEYMEDDNADNVECSSMNGLRSLQDKTSKLVNQWTSRAKSIFCASRMRRRSFNQSTCDCFVNHISHPAHINVSKT